MPSPENEEVKDGGAQGRIVGLGKLLKAARDRAGLSRPAVERAIGLSKNTIKGWELYDKVPGLEAVLQVADLYSASLDEMFGRGLPVGTAVLDETLYRKVLEIDPSDPAAERQVADLIRAPLPFEISFDIDDGSRLVPSDEGRARLHDLNEHIRKHYPKIWERWESIIRLMRGSDGADES